MKAWEALINNSISFLINFIIIYQYTYLCFMNAQQARCQLTIRKSEALIQGNMM